MLPRREVAEALSAVPVEPPDPWKPCSWTFTHDGRACFVKDIHRTHPLFRATIGRLALWRESRIYRRMADLPFVPRYLGRLDRDSLVFECLSGARPLSAVRDGTDLSPDYFDRVEEHVRELHRRGILHMDLRHRSNLLVDADGKPCLVDFESALFLGSGPLSLGFLRPLLAWADHSAVVKFRARYQPESLSSKQVRRYHRFAKLRRLWPFGRVWPPRGRRRNRREALSQDGS